MNDFVELNVTHALFVSRAMVACGSEQLKVLFVTILRKISSPRLFRIFILQASAYSLRKRIGLIPVQMKKDGFIYPISCSWTTSIIILHFHMPEFIYKVRNLRAFNLCLLVLIQHGSLQHQQRQHNLRIQIFRPALIHFV